MIVLALETSTARGGVALVKDQELLGLTEWERGKSHSELLTSAIESTLKKANLTLKDIGAFGVDHGPGSFTGLRVGVNAARALGFAEHKPVVGVSSLEILAKGTSQDTLPLICLMNAYKNLMFMATFYWQDSAWVMVQQPSVISIQALTELVQEPHVCVGDGYTTYSPFFSEALKNRLVRREGLSDEPRVVPLAHLVQDKLKLDSTFEWNTVIPLYLRASEAEERLKK